MRQTIKQKELRRLSRRDLLVLMLEQAQRIEALERYAKEKEAQAVRERKEQELRHAAEINAERQRAAAQITVLRARLAAAQKEISAPNSLVETIRKRIGAFCFSGKP